MIQTGERLLSPDFALQAALKAEVQPFMIARHWKGIAKPGEHHHYVAHLKNETFPNLAQIDGFISASILKRTVSRGTEFLVVTVWESMDAITRFAGEQTDVAVVPDVAQAMMIDYDRTVRHYEVVETFESG